MFFSESKIHLFSFSEKAVAVNNSLFHESFLEGSHRDGGELGRRDRKSEANQTFSPKLKSNIFTKIDWGIKSIKVQIFTTS